MKKNKRKIYFRADADSQIGYGHFIRTLALADMLRDDFDCTFFTQSPSEYQQIEVEKVCPLVCLSSDDRKFDEFLNHLSGDEIVVLDNYFNKYSYQKKIKQKGCKLVSIDDIHLYPFCSDVVICPDPCSPADFITDKNTKLYCGIEWSLLRKPFIDNSNSNMSESNEIVVALGGADPYCLTQIIVDRLLRETNYRISAIIGDKTKFQSLDERVTIHRKLPAEEVASLFSKAGVAILSASTICIEALCIGCPVIAGYYVHNQIEFYNYLSHNSLIVPIGNLLDRGNTFDICSAIKSAKINTHKVIIDFSHQKESFRNIFSTL